MNAVLMEVDAWLYGMCTGASFSSLLEEDERLCAFLAQREEILPDFLNNDQRYHLRLQDCLYF